MRDPRNIVNDEARRHAAAPSRIGRPCAVGRAFTLIELLTVIGIIAILIGVLFPAIRAISESGKIEAAVNTINVAVGAARTFATTRQIDDLDAPDVTYDGVALLFTPSGEMRFIENRQRARTPTNLRLEDECNAPDGLNGYRDLPTDYVRLPKGTGVVGISRGSNSGTSVLRLYAPPFAICFNRHGGLMVGTGSTSPFNRSRLVYYDANHDDRYYTGSGGSDGTSNRSNPFGEGTYDPGKWDPSSPIYVAELVRSSSASGQNTGFDTDPKYSRHTLPFEEIESVIGVLVFNLNDLRSAVRMPSGQDVLRSNGTGAADEVINTNAKNWILATDSSGNLVNAKAILFSRMTGKMMRE